MDYKQHYNKLIERARNRLLEGYTENHHIIPRCMNGTNDVKNIVALTPEEHYVAHQLLVKIYPKTHKLIHAAHLMTVSSKYNCRNNKLYGWLKRRCSIAARENNLGKKHKEETKIKIGNGNRGKKLLEETKIKIGNGNRGKKRSDEFKQNISKKLKGRKHTKERKQKISKKLKDRIPWNKGLKTGPLADETKTRISISKKRVV